MLLGLSLTGCRHKDMIPVIGFDEAGNSQQTFVPHSEYRQRLLVLTSSVQKSTIPVLNKMASKNNWNLRMAVFGISVNAEISLGPIRIGAMPGARLIFSNMKDLFIL